MAVPWYRISDVSTFVLCALLFVYFLNLCMWDTAQNYVPILHNFAKYCRIWHVPAEVGKIVHFAAYFVTYFANPGKMTKTLLFSILVFKYAKFRYIICILALHQLNVLHYSYLVIWICLRNTVIFEYVAE